MAENGYDNADFLTVNDKHTYKEWILDFRCSYHMTPFKKWFDAYKVVTMVWYTWEMIILELWLG